MWSPSSFEESALSLFLWRAGNIRSPFLRTLKKLEIMAHDKRHSSNTSHSYFERREGVGVMAKQGLSKGFANKVVLNTLYPFYCSVF